VGPRTRPTIPSPRLVPGRTSGRGGGSRRKGKTSQNRAKGRIKASRTKVKMSSSGSVEVAPGSVDHCGEHGGPAGTSPAPVGGVIPGVALPAAGAGDTPPPTLLVPAMLVRLYRVTVGVVAALPEDVNTSERLQGFLAMRPDLALRCSREQRRGFLTRLDTTALVSADRKAGEVVHSDPGLALGADRASCVPDSAWATRLAGLPDGLVRAPAVRYDSIISAPVIRAPIEDEYPVWLAATVSRVKALAAPPAYLNLLYMPIPGPYLRKLPITPPSCHSNSEQRARRRGFLISWNQQEFWRLPSVMRTQFFAAVTTWFAQMETPIGFTTGGSLVAYYARAEIYRSCRDAHSVTRAIWVTEYLVVACTCWYEEARDGRFWLFSDALLGWAKQLARRSSPVMTRMPWTSSRPCWLCGRLSRYGITPSRTPCAVCILLVGAGMRGSRW